MNKKKMKFAVGSGIIILTIAYLVITGVSKTSTYFLSLAELAERGPSIHGTGIRVKGNVVAGSIKREMGSLMVDFQISDDSKKTLPVHYKGVVPDLFKEGIDVVVEGHVAPDGVFQAATLLTSCPSKYEGQKEHPTSS
ncbi:MAG: cytochrome c maturation protein CcmE [Nitrospinae bacterium]|nr:cytochrome c maturation protein CcmE [Nitrospinota bacterium]